MAGAGCEVELATDVVTLPTGIATGEKRDPETNKYQAAKKRPEIPLPVWCPIGIDLLVNE